MTKAVREENRETCRHTFQSKKNMRASKMDVRATSPFWKRRLNDTTEEEGEGEEEGGGGGGSNNGLHFHLRC